MGKEELTFNVSTVDLLNEVVNCALPPNMGVLKIPLNIFKNLLCQVAERAIEIDDPQLNVLMLKLGLYEVSPRDIPRTIETQQERMK